MDGPRFDDVAKIFSTFATRRLALALLSALGVGSVLLAGEPAAKKKNKKKKKHCPQGRPRCGNKCCTTLETCKNGKCVDHCKDGKKNLGETDVDCGGTCIPETCGVFKRCEFDADCFVGICEDIGPGGTKICAMCRTDVDCIPHSGTPRCLEHICHDCAADFDCPAPGDFPEKIFCVAPAGVGCPNNLPCVCRECRQDPDCPPGSFCDDQTGNCEGSDCIENEDCPTGVACEDGACTGTCEPPGPCPQCANNPDVSCCNFLCGGVMCCDFGQDCNEQNKTCS